MSLRWWNDFRRVQTTFDPRLPNEGIWKETKYLFISKLIPNPTTIRIGGMRILDGL